ncbi:hypothetical protein B0H17DRAFT_435951 [Mycena rosella]|uniref:Alpha/beta hydrolase fold-3 domain-containing protein n=1 Tax=Mycena rosella TaxID=1033263 RepID=A0AAD7CGX0_MYCRO|nr:hypothetical protein B0H17DRAFT_435951 [Mycena rosella]
MAAGAVTLDLIPTLRQLSGLLLKSQYAVEEHAIAVEGSKIRVRTISPTPEGTENHEFPILVYYYGGGWALWDLDLNEFDLRILTVDVRLTQGLSQRSDNELQSRRGLIHHPDI